MKLACKDITKVILPAVRASVAEEMYRKHGYKQDQIAKELGVVQVAVSKYLNKRYSSKTVRVKKYINSNRLNQAIVRKILGSRPKQEVENEIEKLCGKLIKFNAA